MNLVSSPHFFSQVPKLSVQEIHEDWELGCLQISIKSPFHQIIIVFQIWLWINTYTYHFLVGWTSIYQLFWCSPGVQGFDTLPFVGGFPSSIMSLSLHCLVPVAGAAPCTAWAKTAWCGRAQRPCMRCQGFWTGFEGIAVLYEYLDDMILTHTHT